MGFSQDNTILCHPERSEGSLDSLQRGDSSPPTAAQNDKKGRRITQAHKLLTLGITTPIPVKASG